LWEQVALILDDGQCKFGQPSTVVEIRDNHWQLVREGVFNESTLKRLASFILLFVCTGNTCRSPMANVLMQQHLAQRLGVGIEQLEDRGLLVMSAGIAAMSGGHASPEALRVMTERGLDLSRHESQPLSDRLVRFADLILTMTRGHREAILAQWSNAASRTHVLGSQAGDLADPVGGSTDTYRQCAKQIDEFLKPWLDQLQLDRIVATGGSGG
jgi:protein-tyrosine-phosphatase